MAGDSMGLKEAFARHEVMCVRPSREPLIKSHRGRCGKNGPRARRLHGRIPLAGCNREANVAPSLLSPQPAGLKSFFDFCLTVSRRPHPSDCFAGHIVSPDTRCCGVTRLGETPAGIDSLAPARLALTGFLWQIYPSSSRSYVLPSIRVLKNQQMVWVLCS